MPIWRSGHGHHSDHVQQCRGGMGDSDPIRDLCCGCTASPDRVQEGIGMEDESRREEITEECQFGGEIDCSKYKLSVEHVVVSQIIHLI
jgi:hypothetical protein